MALKKTVTTTHGFEAVGAYHRVEELNFDGKGKIDFVVKSYKAPGYSSFKTIGMSCAYDLSGMNPFAQAYAFLKTTDEFSGAEDC